MSEKNQAILDMTSEKKTANRKELHDSLKLANLKGAYDKTNKTAIAVGFVSHRVLPLNFIRADFVCLGLNYHFCECVYFNFTVFYTGGGWGQIALFLTKCHENINMFGLVWWIGAHQKLVLNCRGHIFENWNQFCDDVTGGVPILYMDLSFDTKPQKY